jgi:propionate CoA-transferase
VAKFITAAEAAELIKDNDWIGASTFGASGVPESIYKAIEKRFLETGHPANITYVHAAGSGDFGPGHSRGEDCLAHEGLMTRWIASHVVCSKTAQQMLGDGTKIAGWNLPLGTILQIFKEQARGVNFCISKVGLDTFVDPRQDGGKITKKAHESGEEWVKYLPDFEGEEWLLYKGWPLTVGMMRGTYADEDGNISCEKEPYNLEMLTVAQAVKACGGKVFVEVERMVKKGTLNPKMVKVPGLYIDYVVVMDPADIPNKVSTVGGMYNPCMTGEIRMPMEVSGSEPLPFDGIKVICRRAAMEFRAGIYSNLGLGMPQKVGNIFDEEGVAGDITLISESGNIGGVPGVGTNFGAHYNVEASCDQGDHFNMFDGMGLDIVGFGLSEADPLGAMNTSMLNGTIVGVGGFMNIATTARKSVILGTFTAAGIKISVKDGKLVIDKEGKFKKFVKKLPQSSFSAQNLVKSGKPVIYITERAVFNVVEGGMELIEIAPGVDLQKDVLDQMEFKPIIPEGGPKLMPAEIFQEKWGKLKDIFYKDQK